ARRADLRARAMDLAQSRLAELDAGLIAVGDLAGDAAREPEMRDESADLVVSIELSAAPGAPDAMIARATVRARSNGVSGEGPVIIVTERVVSMGASTRATTRATTGARTGVTTGSERRTARLDAEGRR
ncbi:MAG: hypothetical protein ACKO3W_11680, partial [bacterium]